jgi:hypothetical protein
LATRGSSAKKVPLIVPKFYVEVKSMNRPKRAELRQKHGHANITIDFYRERHNLWWSRLSEKRRAEWLLGQLWNCTDILPGMARSEVREWFSENQEPFTFGQLARLLKRDLDSQNAPSPDQVQVA